MIQPRLSEYLGQAIVIENKAGAVANLEAARAAPDGHTLLLTADVLSVLHHLRRELPYDGYRAFAPVKMMISAATVLAVNAAFPAKSLREYVAYAKGNPGKLNQGNAANGSRGHIAAAVLASESGLELTHVPFRGSGLGLALISGDIHAAFLQYGAIADHLRSGKVRALAVTGKTRLDQLPTVPAVAELVPGFEVIAWFGIFAPARTPNEVVARLHREFTRALALPDIREKVAAIGFDIDTRTPEEFAAFIEAESDKFGKVIRQYNIRAE